MSKVSQPRETLTVDGIKYSWWLRHGSFFESGDGFRGLSVTVCLLPSQKRELIVDFPYSAFGMETAPKNSVLVRHLAAAIRSALAEGWNSESRGKPFRFCVSDVA